MAQKTTIKKDALGLYVVAGGWICRPFAGTMFKEGDEVKTHHFGGSTDAGVTFNDTNFNFRERGKYETWCTTGVISFEYTKRVIPPDQIGRYKSFDDYLKSNTDWYKQNCFWSLSKEDNIEFKNKYKK